MLFLNIKYPIADNMIRIDGGISSFIFLFFSASLASLANLLRNISDLSIGLLTSLVEAEIFFIKTIVQKHSP